MSNTMQMRYEVQYKPGIQLKSLVKSNNRAFFWRSLNENIFPDLITEPHATISDLKPNTRYVVRVAARWQFDTRRSGKSRHDH